MANATRLIKKYPNRRLYDTQTSAYITLVDIKQLVLDHEDFRVIDAKTNDDLTRGILLQIILEEEAGGTPLFSSSMLVQIIRFYGHATQGMMGTYLEKTMQAFVEIQHRMQEQSKTFYDAKGMPNPELWAQFMSMQTPMVQAMMGNYIEQSKNLFVQMQEQMQTQTRNMFQKFPFSGVQAFGGTQGGSNGASGGAEARSAAGAAVPGNAGPSDAAAPPGSGSPGALPMGVSTASGTGAVASGPNASRTGGTGARGSATGPAGTAPAGTGPAGTGPTARGSSRTEPTGTGDAAAGGAPARGAAARGAATRGAALAPGDADDVAEAADARDRLSASRRSQRK